VSSTKNKLLLVGALGRHPEIEQTPTGKVARCSLGTRRTPRPGDPEGLERTDWHRLELRGRLADFAQDFLRIGDRVYIEGQVEYGHYERNGLTVPTTTIGVTEIVLLSGSGGSSSPGDDEG